MTCGRNCLPPRPRSHPSVVVREPLARSGTGRRREQSREPGRALPDQAPRGRFKGPSQGPLVSRVSSGGLCPTGLPRGGSKGPSQGPFLGRVSSGGLCPTELSRGGSKGPSQGPFVSRVSSGGLCPTGLSRGGSKGPSQGPFLSRLNGRDKAEEASGSELARSGELDGCMAIGVCARVSLSRPVKSYENFASG